MKNRIISTLMHHFFHLEGLEGAKRAQKNLREEFMVSDRNLLVIFSSFWLFLFLLGGLKDGNNLMGFLGGGIALVLSFLAYRYCRGTSINRILIGLLGGWLNILYIQQMHGAPTSHLLFFVTLGALLFYRDAFAILACLLLVSIYQGLSTYLSINTVEIFLWSFPIAVLLVFLTYSSMTEFQIHEKHLLKEEVANEDLKKRIAEQNAQLAEESRTVRAILEHISDAIFTITQNQTIDVENSSQIESFIGQNKLDNQSMVSLLFSNTNLSEAEKTLIEQALDASLGQDRTNFDQNQHLLPINCRKEIHGIRKNLEFSWTPILNSDKVVEKIVVRIADVTQIQDLQATTERQFSDLKIIPQLASTDPKTFFSFLNLSEKVIVLDRAFLLCTQPKHAQALNMILLHMDMIKKRALSLDLFFLENSISKAEQRYFAYQKDKGKLTDSEFLLRELGHIYQRLQHFRSLAETSLGWKGTRSVGPVERLEIVEALEALMDLDLFDSEELYNALKRSIGF